VLLIERTGHMLLYKQLDPFVRGVSEFLPERRRPPTGFSGRTVQNVALDAT
jgi:hypothetical protein